MSRFTRSIALSVGLALVWGTQAAQAQCARSVDSKRVVLFIDANASYREARAAEQAACQQGEKFVMIPENSWRDLKAYEDTFATLRVLEAQAEAVSEQIVSIRRGNKSDPRLEALIARQDALFKQVQAREQKVEELAGKLNGLDRDLADATIAKLAKSGAAIASLVVSGHDGGGLIAGKTGVVDFSSLRESISRSYAANPAFKGCPIESVFLWGCYTAVPSGVVDWKSQFSCLKVMGGFFGAAPLAIRPASAQLISQMINSKDRLASAKTREQFDSALASMAAFGDTKAAVFACSGSDASKGFYAANPGGDHGGGQKPIRGRLGEVMQCGSPETNRAIDELRSALRALEEGNYPIPEDTSGGAVRQLYNKARFLQACITVRNANDSNYSDRVGLLLFFHGVKQVFARTFEKEIGEAKDEIASLAGRDSRLLPVPDSATIKKMGRDQLLEYMSQLQGSLARITGGKSSFPKSKRFARLMEVYLDSRDTRCMEPWLAWHDASEKATPVIPQTPLCRGEE